MNDPHIYDEEPPMLLFSVPLPGPLHYSKRLGRRRERSGHTPTSDLATLRRLRDEADTAPADVVARRHRIGWIVAGTVSALLLLAAVWTAPLVLVILGGTLLGHRARYRRRAALGLEPRHRS